MAILAATIGAVGASPARPAQDQATSDPVVAARLQEVIGRSRGLCGGAIDGACRAAEAAQVVPIALSGYYTRSQPIEGMLNEQAKRWQTLFK